MSILILQLRRIVLVLTLTAITLGTSPRLAVHAQGSEPLTLDQFDLLTASSGWILINQRLFWTSDAGQTWQEIGPSIPADGSIQDVEFMDASSGWILWTTLNPNGSTSFQLAHTVDRGNSWSTHSLSIFEAGEIASYAEKAHMGWLDAQTGWIAVKQQTSSNFSIGTLFTTLDGGESWKRSTLPVADEIFFSDAQTGWAVGGPNNDRVFSTQDGGTTWEKFQPADLPQGIQSVTYQPFVSEGQGLLLVSTMGEESILKVYSLDDVSSQWRLIHAETLDVQPGIIGLSILNPQNFVAAIPATTSMLRMVNGTLSRLENTDGLSASIVDLDMVSLDVGWAKSIDSNCSADPGSETCSANIRLLQTTDGGATWRGVQLPLVQSDNISIEYPRLNNAAVHAGESASLENTGIFIGQGFDRCEISTLSRMQTWWNASPYETVNLYIGGSSRACSNNSLTSSYLFQLNQQGWKFIPTWVGPQAPCTGYLSRISSDPVVAYTQGVAEANLAVERLAALGLTGPEKSGSVIYYDIEAYGTNQACRNAVNAFMDGWVSQVRVRGNLAGVYGSTLCNTGLSDFLTIPNVPDVIWPARWYHNLGAGFYDPNASVWNLGSCIPNNVWANHQRIRQYEGDHNETWGGLTLDIDSNVLDGVVAFPFGYPHVGSILRSNSNPSASATVDFTVTFSKIVTGVNSGDFRLTSGGVTGASITGVSGSDTTYTVTVSTGAGNGTLRLDLMDDDSIRDELDLPLGGSGTGNGSYTGGEAYTIHKGNDKDTVGVFRPSNGLLYLKNSHTSGYADIAINYGVGGDSPVVGDWDGDGDATIGVYRNGRFLLRNSNTVGVADLNFPFGQVGDQPIAGDWDGDGDATIGVYRPSTGQFLLRNSNSAGPEDASFYLGNVGDVGIAGDWDGDGMDTTGVFRPGNGVIYLKNTNVSGFADVALHYGNPGDRPVVGDWDNDGTTTIGIYRNARFYLRNSNTVGIADLQINLGNPGDLPIAGNWDALP